MNTETRGEREPCIPFEMLPSKEVTETVDPRTGERVLVVNDVMFTAYQRSQGSLSLRFFIPLRDKAVIMGARCPSCNQIICPPFQLMCPECNFIDMELMPLPDCGIMMASPPITLFANSFFKQHAPFARGYVRLGEAQTGLNVWCKTTTGMIRPGIFKRGTPVKIVFNDERQGLITDICAVPEVELRPELVSKSPLFSSEVNWKAIKRPEFAESQEIAMRLQELLAMEPEIQTAIRGSPRALANLKDWNVTVQCHSAAGVFVIRIANNTVHFRRESMPEVTFELAVQDPAVFLRWWREGYSLTNLLMEGTMWLSDPLGLETIFKLDRLPRSIRRDR